MDRRFYRTGEFAQIGSVSIRTLRYYDDEGLLAPSRLPESGYRLYTDSDLVSLQQILALKFLGFALEEIKALRSAGPSRLQDVLAQQKAMMIEKLAHLEDVVHAIEQAERLVKAGERNWDAIVKVIRAIQMDQNTDWVQKYFSPEQIKKMEEMSSESYSEEARRKLATRGPWTEADQKRADAQWAAVGAELKRLTAEGADPEGEEAQALARQFTGLIRQFTGGDPEIAQGLWTWWSKYGEMPVEQRPFQPPWGDEEAAFLNKALSSSEPRQE